MAESDSRLRSGWAYPQQRRPAEPEPLAPEVLASIAEAAFWWYACLALAGKAPSMTPYP